VVIILLLAVGAILGFMLFGQMSRDKVRTVADKVGGTSATLDGGPSTNTSGLATGDGSGGTAAAMSGTGGTAAATGGSGALGPGGAVGSEEVALGGGKRKLGEVDEPEPAPVAGAGSSAAGGINSPAEVYGAKANTPVVFEEEKNPYAWSFPYLAFIAMAVFMFLMYYLFMAPKPGKQ